ncbi:MAG: alpha/beta fold hydrolase [Williamsia herbipolensis]|uniref:Pimeloyl-ACP methyl ester carboxylesterase n=1 Tax=Williamsia serinedens TaxID=391736 RepID=A0ABT1GYG9_9NOCA|nr:alpha/beta fold hydrolase [Williamsia serinedens]MBE7162188.1 alpha/beta fold hydrolase [Williamsia herbipolensis]MCP2160034.1 Pimeloyl-ACP methyl ester carboxylesterase [Williamsia serinedens]
MTDRITEFRNGDLTFDVVDTGPLDSPGADGAVVVALHGFPQTKESWRRVAADLAGRGIRTIAPDQRGYSPGARPRGRRAYAIPELVSDVAALVDRIGGPVHLVGHDWGAIAGWATASRRPELLQTYTALSVPHPAAFLTALGTSSQALRSWYMAAIQLPVVPERGVRAVRPRLEASLRRSGLDDESLAIVRERVVETEALTGGMNWYRGMPFGLGGAAGDVTVPTTFIWGARDSFLTRTGAIGTAAHVLGKYRFEVVEDGGHWLPETHPALVAELVAERIDSVR